MTLRSNLKFGSEMSTTSVSFRAMLSPPLSLNHSKLLELPLLGLDGSTSATDRDRLIRRFNDHANPVKLFLVSTR